MTRTNAHMHARTYTKVPFDKRYKRPQRTTCDDIERPVYDISDTMDRHRLSSNDMKYTRYIN